MAPKRWIEKAHREMKKMGYSRADVEPVLRNLLETYGNGYKLIEEDGFKVLVEALLANDQEKERKKKLEPQLDDSEEDEEEIERLVKRSKRNNQQNQSSGSRRDSIPNRSNGVDDQPYSKPKMAESTYKDYQYMETGMGESESHDVVEDVVPLVVVLPAPSLPQYASSVGKHSSFKGSHSESTNAAKDKADEKDKFLGQLNYLEEEEEDWECEPLLKRRKRNNQQNQSTNNHYQNLETGAGISDSDNTVAEKTYPQKEPGSLGNAIDDYLFEAVVEGEPSTNCELPDCDVRLDEAVPAPLLPKVASSVDNRSYAEGNRSESTKAAKFEEENEKCAQEDFLKLDLASSSNGKVKISLMADSSLGPDFLLLEDVIKKVEGAQIGLSVLKLMTDLCEHFLAEHSRHPNEVLSLDIPSSQIVQSEGTNRQFSLCSELAAMLKSPVKIRNVVEVSSQIPKSLNLSRCVMNLVEDATDCSEKTLVPSPSTKMNYYIKDITKGLEAHEISLINEVSEDPCSKFTYLMKNVNFKFQLALISEKNCCAQCFEDCLASNIPCACSLKTGGEFAYKPGGLLKKKFLESCIESSHSAEKHNLFYCHDCPLERVYDKSPPGKCKGHIVRKFIKECWYKCGCSMKCGNRVVQKGIQVKLQVFMTSGRKGWGVRVLENVPKGSFICEYVGEVVINTELYKRNMSKNGERRTYPVVLDADWKGTSIDEEALCLDATDYGNVARFINHRCSDSNLVEVPVEVETPDHQYYHLAFFTKKDVTALEELTWDYGIDFSEDTHPVKAFHCQCNSEFCRDKKSVKSRV